jgi:hypothetical protein
MVMQVYEAADLSAETGRPVDISCSASAPELGHSNETARDGGTAKPPDAVVLRPK